MTDPQPTIFIGIDPTGARDALVYVALDADRRILAIGGGKASDVLAFAAGQSQALAAVNAPSGPNLGLTEREQVRQHLFAEPGGGRWSNLRLAEAELAARGLPGPRTPARVEDCPAWMQRGFQLARQLNLLGYQTYPQPEAARQQVEVQAAAVFASFSQGSLFDQRSLEGRLQRQLILHEQDLPVQDPMDFFEEVTRHRLMRGVLPFEMIYRPHELNALACAFTAWLAVHQPEQVLTLGDQEEGQVLLPVIREP